MTENTINKVKNENQTEYTDNKGIMVCLINFYKALYSRKANSEQNVQIYLDDINFKKKKNKWTEEIEIEE